MNTIWFLMMTLSLCFLVFSNPSTALSSMISAGGDALSLAIELCAVYAVWLGILELVEASGLSQKLAKFLHPVIKWLFKIDDPETEKLIALNMSANMLGLGNAATPMGIAAMNMFPVHILNIKRALMEVVRSPSIPLRDAVNVEM